MIAAPQQLVSVVLSTYNGEDVLSGALESILCQTHAWLEVVVVDDGSTDRTWDRLKDFGAKIRVLRQPNGGLAAARNAGLRESSGAYVALMDHDDLCEPDRIAWQLRCLQELPEAVLCCSDFSAFDSHGVIAPSYCEIYYSRCASKNGGVRARYPMERPLRLAGSVEETRVFHGLAYEELALGNFVHPPTVFFRRELLDRIGGFDPAYGQMCDWEWLIRASRTGHFAHIDRPLLRYRRSDGQMSSNGYARGFFSAMKVVDKLEQDAVLVSRKRRALRRLRAEFMLAAAYLIADHERARALALLARGVWLFALRPPLSDACRTLWRIAIPAPLQAAVRQFGARRGKA